MLGVVAFTNNYRYCSIKFMCASGQQTHFLEEYAVETKNMLILGTSPNGGGGLESVSVGEGLTGDGTTESPVTLQVSRNLNNSVKILSGTSDSPGLYVRSVDNSIVGGSTILVRSAPGTDGAAKIAVNISGRSGNAISVVEEGEGVAGVDVGLYVPTSSSNSVQIRSQGGYIGAWKTYPSDFTQPAAFSAAGGRWRYKATTLLDIDGKYNKPLVLNVRLGAVPCDASGIPLPHSISVVNELIKVSGVFRQHFVLLLTVEGIPTQVMDVTSGKMTTLSDIENGNGNWSLKCAYIFQS